MKKTSAIICVIIGVLLFSSCASFLNKDDESRIAEYDKKEYILKEDAGEGDRSIKKGEKVKLYIKTGEDYIKVYCYPYNKDFVKAERTLIVYLFKEDFENSVFDIYNFEDKLYGKVEAINK